MAYSKKHSRKMSKKNSRKMSKKNSRKMSKKRSHKMSKKHSRKMSKKRSRSPGRVRRSPSNPCSMLNKPQCGGDPNCHYVSKRGCLRRSGVATRGVRYAGPVTPAATTQRALGLKRFTL